MTDEVEVAEKPKRNTLQAPRKGKTARKRESGAFARNAMNKDARVAWRQDRNATNATFPTHSCNGKKNRSVRVVKKNGKPGRRV